jgi:hypothetical protein
MRSKLFALVLFFLCVVPLSLILTEVEVFAQCVDTAWVKRYNGPGNLWDGAQAIAVDGSGNVYVTGSSVGSGTFDDYTTIKYYPNGDTAWARRYNGPGNYIDDASAIAVDDSGNVCVTGRSYGGSGTFDDYTTIKYYPNGDTAWVRRYNGPGNGTDEACAIAVDDSGYVYVTGYIYTGGGLSSDYGTIKYCPNGDTAWVRTYNRLGHSDDLASAIAVDNSGNVYVTGWSDTTYSGPYYADYATIKYYPNGDTAWVRRYDGPPGNSTDIAYAIAVDNSGNACVTGASVGSGTWVDYATIKYYPNGDTAWVRRYNRYLEQAKDIAVDGSGNIYVTGYGNFPGDSTDYITIKYYPNGGTAWVRIYNGPGDGADTAYAIAVDGSNNVYVTGVSYESGTSLDYATIKYYPSGDTAWVRRYNGLGNDDDGAYGIAVDDSGNVYVTGTSFGSGTYTDYTTIKYFQYYLTDTVTVVAFSPVDLIVTDPQGDSIGISFNTIPSASYDTAQDWNHDGDKDDIVTIPNRLVGDYLIRVFAEPVAEKATYSMGIRIDGSDMAMLATDHPCPLPNEADTIFYNAPWFMRGDADGDWWINAVDVVYLINYLYIRGPAPQPLEAGDVNCDGTIDASDVVYLINYLFIKGPPPCS